MLKDIIKVSLKKQHNNSYYETSAKPSPYPLPRQIRLRRSGLSASREGEN
jgi:hypothetical protein